MNNHQLEKLPGNTIASFKQPQSSQNQWIIPGYCPDGKTIQDLSSFVYGLFGALFIVGYMIAFVGGIGSFWSLGGFPMGFPIIILVLVGYCLWKILQWINYQRSHLSLWIKSGEIRLSAYPLQLGETYSFSCHQELHPKKPLTQAAKWTIQLICAEVVTFGDASSPSHERWILHRETLHEQKLPIGSSPNLVANCQFKLPAEGIPSFEAKNNRIRWQIESKLELNDRPQLQKSGTSGGLLSGGKSQQQQSPSPDILTRKSEYIFWVEPDC
jgi:hypothetical protein